jgi:hypothetical protein
MLPAWYSELLKLQLQFVNKTDWTGAAVKQKGRIAFYVLFS